MAQVQIIGRSEQAPDCPACGHGKARRTDVSGVVSCSACGCYHGSCWLGDSYRVAKAQMTGANVSDDDLRAFDLMTVGSTGEQRRHGWVDVRTGLIYQVG